MEISRPLAANVPLPPGGCPNRFGIGKKRPGDFSLKAKAGRVNVIEALEGMIITGWAVEEPKIAGGIVVPDTARDMLKIAVVNRYTEAPPALGLIRNFGLKQGAMASSVAHDSHNIVAVGVGDAELCDAVNLVIENRGGLSAVGPGFTEVLPLPVAGIMSDEDGYLVAEKYSRMDATAKLLGSKLRAPFMTLPVIPKLKMTDRGLFDAERFRFVDLQTA
jgi:adenine deaminase